MPRFFSLIPSLFLLFLKQIFYFRDTHGECVAFFFSKIDSYSNRGWGNYDAKSQSSWYGFQAVEAKNKQLLGQLPVSAHPLLRANLHFPPAEFQSFSSIHDISTVAVPRSVPGAYAGTFVRADKTALMEVSCKLGVNLAPDDPTTNDILLRWRRRGDNKRQ